MNNHIGMFGKGRVVEGRIVFTEVLHGQGFTREISRPVAESKPAVTPVIRREPAVRREVSMIEPLDVPNFMKNRKPAVVKTVVVAEPVNKVVSLNNGYEGESSLRKDVKKALKKLNNWLWDLED